MGLRTRGSRASPSGTGWAPGAVTWAFPPGHPAYHKDYDSIDVDVHGGLTYANECSPPICHTPKPDEPDDVYWLGFDCGHAYDLMPGHDAIMRKFHIRTMSHHPWEVYRDMEYVEGQIRSLAEQLAKMTT